MQQDDYLALSVALHSFAPHKFRWTAEGEVSAFVWSCEVKQDLDIGSFQYSCGNEKGLASLQGLDFPGLYGSPTWARTRDLRINNCELPDCARLLETSWDSTYPLLIKGLGNFFVSGDLEK